MQLHATIIDDPQKFAEIEDELTLFVEENSQNPFSLPPFLKNRMLEVLKQNQVPVVIVFRNEKEIVGLAPLKLTRKFGANTAKFLLGLWTSIDFVIKNEYRQSVVTNVADVLFKRLHCKLVTLNFPEESPNINIFEQSCKRLGVLSKKKSEEFMGHGIVFPNSLENRRHFRKELRLTERKLAKAGSTKIILEEGGRGHEADDAVYDKLMAVDKNSWKLTYRSTYGQESDDGDLRWFLNSTNYLNKSRFLKRKIWFLELDGKPIAFQLVLEYKRTAYLCKISFVDKYRKLGLGIYLSNSVIRETFDGKNIEKIDFLTNLPYEKKWRAKIVPRVHFSAGSRVMFGLQSLVATSESTFHLLQGRKKNMFYLDTARVQLEHARHNSIILRALRKLPL